jgi:hypothetical protein
LDFASRVFELSHRHPHTKLHPSTPNLSIKLIVPMEKFHSKLDDSIYTQHKSKVNSDVNTIEAIKSLSFKVPPQKSQHNLSFSAQEHFPSWLSKAFTEKVF